LIFDDFVRVYFSCRPPKDKQGQYVSYSAFVDLDRNNLFNIINIANKPIIKLGDKGCFDEYGIYPVSVIKEKDEIWSYYTGHTRCESVPFDTAIGYAVSLDNGMTFNKLDNGPVISSSLFEPFCLSGPKIRKFNNTYYLFYIAGKKWIRENGKAELIYKIRLASSNDGINWEKNNTDLIEEKLGENEVQASPDVFFFNDKYHMFFCYMLTPDFRFDVSKQYRIGYASSTDLVSWNRDDSKAGIDISEDGFDNQMVAYPHVFELDNKIYMLYLGNEVGRFGFGLAELEGEL
jgi:sucrose-6-phosphate hydrolase SacC (GH32 family)